MLQPVEPTVEDFVRELRKAAETGIDGNVKDLLHKINIKYKVCLCSFSFQISCVYKSLL